MSKIIQSKILLSRYFQHKSLDQKDYSLVAEQKFSFLSPTAYLDKIDWSNDSDPLKKMIWPDDQELDIQNYQIADPIGDLPHLAVPNLVHRYPDRVLFLLTNQCQINCRFCFRRELTHHQQPADLNLVFDYLSQHSEVKEVIFSGGDPLTLSPKYLHRVYQKLSQIPHLKIFRFHTRIPVVNPDWITQPYLELFTEIAKNHQLVVALHINHSREISSELIDLAHQLTKVGAMLLSQTVLLSGINDQPQVLADLFNELITFGVKPYYLHHPDLVKGTHHFRLSIQAGLEIYKQMKRLVSGFAVPLYVLDLPGGNGKVTIESLELLTGKKYLAVNFRGETITYLDPNG